MFPLFNHLQNIRDRLVIDRIWRFRISTQNCFQLFRAQAAQIGVFICLIALSHKLNPL